MPEGQDVPQTIDVPAPNSPDADSVEATVNLPPAPRGDTVVPPQRLVDAVTVEIEPIGTAVPGGRSRPDPHLSDTHVTDLSQEARPAAEDKTVELGQQASLTAATLDFGSAGAPSTHQVNDSRGAPMSGPMPAPVPCVAGYQILSVLGRGGMGVVYKARQEKLNRLVALKMVLAGAHASPQQLNRFFIEAEAVARLQHPNIVQIYEVGEYDGLPFFSLEYVDGGTLGQKIDGKPRPPREAAGTIELLARAMAVAHGRGIMHRDLKPANVLLGTDGQPKITDFGLAKRIEDDSSQTKSGTLMGTPSYMSPEQARGETRDIGPQSDLYSLGAMLYEMLTGRPPFVGPTVLDTLFQVRNQEPVPARRLQPKCPRDLDTICMKCLQKEPHQRYPSCEALASDLHRFLAHEPIRARPVGLLERTWRWCRRNPRVAGLSMAASVLLLAVIASVAVMLVRQARDRETLAETRKIANDRMQQATQRVAAGNYQQAQDFLQWSDPLLGNVDLADVRSSLETLKARVDVYAQFRKRLDSARFACRFGSRQEKEEGKRYCHDLLALYREIQDHTGRGWAGLPPLTTDQQQFFKEDVFEALLTSAQVEQDLAVGKDAAAQKQAASQALGWLNQADQVLPGTRALLVHRAPCLTRLGDTQAAEAGMNKAKTIPVASAVDHFWHGFSHHHRGEEASRKKDVKTANESYRKEIEEYAAFLQQRPDHFWGYFNWANAHAQLHQRPDAYDALIGYTACIRLQPDFPWPYNNRGTVHLRLGQPKLALPDFDAALKRNHDYTEAYANRGLAYLALKKPDRAVADFNTALARDQSYTEAYAKRGLAYLALQKFDQAIGDFTIALERDPEDLLVRAKRAEALVAQEKYPEARTDFTKILDKAPRALEIWRARAILNWQNLKDFDAALGDFEECTRLAPKDPEPHRCIGVILLGRRQYAQALDALDEAITLRPGYPEAVWARAQIFFLQGQYARALQELDPLVAQLPKGPPETLNMRAGIYRAMGKLKEAAADYERMITANPQSRETYVCLARIYEQQGQPAKAAACFERLLAATKGSAWALVRRGEYRRDHGQFDSAREDCDKAVRLAPNWAVPPLVRASVQAARGEAAQAVAEAERILKTAPRPDGHELYAAACVWSLAAGTCKDPAQKKRFAERAADLLAQTLDKGFHDLIYPEHQRMADDAALAAIRQMPQVRKLLGGPGSSPPGT